MGIFGSIIKGVIHTAAIPVAVAKDAILLPIRGVNEESPVESTKDTLRRLRQDGDDIMEALDDL